ncbi:MFS transporter [Glycomyces sp. L485]|uniref:MFS transporter n=1 Tax=Glycomyces sp. L485 TaxID=2909235 RepID=UPI001F4B745A|nr:MFS transporter [Glycomyces sp. L485]MCH7231929.1 MFS transporter [Glycomyces sp. L485]
MTPVRLRRARIGVFGCFATSGFVMGAWPAAYPSIEARLDLGEARFGAVLLVVEIACLAAMVAAGRLCDKVSSRTVIRYGGTTAQALLFVPALAPSYETLLACAVVYGIGLGFVEVSMQAQSVELERRYGRPIVSSFHGFWSLGGAAAGALAILVFSLGVDYRALLTGTAVAAAIVFACFTIPLLEAPEPIANGTHLDGRPVRIGLILLAGSAAIVFSAAFVEAGAADWANLHAARVLGAADSHAPLSYTVFLVAMTVLRLVGDPIRGRLGPQRSLLLAGALALTGYLLVIASASFGGLALSWTGWALAGIGSAVLMPVMFSAIGAAGGTGSDLAAMSMCGSAAYLLCPAVVGLLAEATGLTVALIVPTALAVAIALAGPIAVTRLLGHRASPPEPVGAAAPRGDV